MLKPHFEELVTSYVFPQLSFTADRQEQWNSDPVEYIRNVIGTSYQRLYFVLFVDGVTDEYENFNSPVSAATSFLFSLASNRTKSSFLPILAFVNRVLQSYDLQNCMMVGEILTTP